MLSASRLFRNEKSINMASTKLEWNHFKVRRLSSIMLWHEYSGLYMQEFAFNKFMSGQDAETFLRVVMRENIFLSRRFPTNLQTIFSFQAENF